MALASENIGNINGQIQYLPTISVIEEEKSEFIETTTKKPSIINGNIVLLIKDLKKKRIKNEFELCENKGKNKMLIIKKI